MPESVAAPKRFGDQEWGINIYWLPQSILRLPSAATHTSPVQFAQVLALPLSYCVLGNWLLCKNTNQLHVVKPLQAYKKQEVLARTSGLLILIRHGPHWKRRVRQFFYCCACIRYPSNVSTESLPSNDRVILPSCCLATIGGYTDTHTHQRDLVSLLYFFKITKVG
jgi:hypothetical protein